MQTKRKALLLAEEYLELKPLRSIKVNIIDGLIIPHIWWNT